MEVDGIEQRAVNVEDNGRHFLIEHFLTKTPGRERCARPAVARLSRGSESCRLGIAT
jgi:hypothetical protein